MRQLPAAVALHLAQKKALNVHGMFWVSARDRTDDTRHGFGLWTGADHQDILVGSGTRRYYGVGGVLDMTNMITDAAIGVRSWDITVSGIHPQVEEAVRVYDVRLAPVEVHLLYSDPMTHNPLADPVRFFRGTVMEMELPTPPIGGTATAVIRCVSDAWRLTRGLTLKRSDAAMTTRDPIGGHLRRHNITSGSVPYAWGESVRN